MNQKEPRDHEEAVDLYKFQRKCDNGKSNQMRIRIELFSCSSTPTHLSSACFRLYRLLLPQQEENYPRRQNLAYLFLLFLRVLEPTVCPPHRRKHSL